MSVFSRSQRALARIGTVVHKCRIERLIGIGGMAAVYAATRDDGQHVAIKFLLERFHEDANMVRLFSQEANVANQVQHRGAVPVLDCSVDEEGCAFLIMPLLDGETVRARWERCDQRMPLAEVGVIVSDTLDVLASAHARGIVHRDIKPDNLFIVSDGELRVLDFGIARRSDRDGSVTLTGHMIGTPAFMSPEQAIGDRRAVGPASDAWSVGATMFTLLSGQFVHETESSAGQLAAAATRQARSLGDVAPHLPLSIARFVDKALAFDPKDRWPSAHSMREGLHASLEGILNEPMATIASRVHAKFAADLAHQTEATYAKQSLRQQDLKSHVRTPVRPWMRFVHSDLEVSAYLPKFFGAMTGTASRILADHGLGQFADTGWFVPDTRPWWPMEPYVLVLHELMDAVGPIKAIDIGKQKVQYVHLPPDLGVHDIHAMMAAVDAAYHLNHRRNGEPLFDIASGRMVDIIGHYHYRGRFDTEQSIAMECENPYPCELDLGILLGFARRFEPRAVVEHAPGPCRKEGAESCTYHVTWW
ncbi:serine/threonine protein kinase [Pendulispora brunnea]|uniref:Serine/threonine protein kinase n=1 Tax=Pendulispora brunnea TaxID=2905690 RepID=A0ABZ2KLZ8_9BACT